MIICVISHHRPENVPLMEQQTDKPIHWFLGLDDDYDAKHTHRAGDLCKARNAALNYAFKHNEPCLMLDDDLVKCQQVSNGSLNTISLDQMAMEMQNVLDSLPVKMAGISPTRNLGWYNPNKPIGYKHFCIASCILVQPNKLRFDEKLRTKEDHDYTLQHIKEYGGVARLNYLMPHFRHYTNKGGVVEYRNLAVEEQSIRYMINKWGKTVQRNKKRKGEILLRVRG